MTFWKRTFWKRTFCNWTFWKRTPWKRTFCKWMFCGCTLRKFVYKPEFRCDPLSGVSVLPARLEEAANAQPPQEIPQQKEILIFFQRVPSVSKRIRGQIQSLWLRDKVNSGIWLRSILAYRVAHGKSVGVNSEVDIRWGYSQLRHSFLWIGLRIRNWHDVKQSHIKNCRFIIRIRCENGPGPGSAV